MGTLDFRKIVSVNLKHQFRGPFLAACVITLLTPVLFPVSALPAPASARPLEMFLLWIGAVLLTPICLPEQDGNIRDCVRVRKLDYYCVCFMRFIYSAVVLFILEGIFVLAMKFGECDVTLLHFLGGSASALFFGCLGFFAAGISGNVIAGYMIQTVYYLMNYGLKDKMGVFYLFSMSAGSFREKWWLYLFSAVLVAGASVGMRMKDKGKF